MLTETDTFIHLLGAHLKQEQMELVLALSYQSDDEILHKNKNEQVNIAIFWCHINQWCNTKYSHTTACSVALR